MKDKSEKILENIPLREIWDYLQSKGAIQLVDINIVDYQNEMVKITKYKQPTDVIEIEGIPCVAGEVELAQKKFIAQHPFAVALIRTGE